ncbi:MAG: polysaccharide biosynthesis/export family protein [Acidobacteria bacterium]|nr:polysaccharide biosynthesis/export family protein [Acidobacteriota bacterium]
MRNFITTLSVTVLALFSFVGISAQTSTPSDVTVAAMEKDDDRYRIGFQDVLEVRVFKHAELSQRVSVSPNGTITLFRLDKPVVAVCKSESELARELAAAFKAKFIRDPEVTVSVAEQRSQSIGVMGAVGKPDYFFVRRRFHLLEMLAMAGGPNKESEPPDRFADRQHVEVQTGRRT